jgi:hypothetical protein
MKQALFSTFAVIVIFFLQVIQQNANAQGFTNYTIHFDNSNFTKTIDLNKPVGVVKGSASVSNSGASSYTIPIETPVPTNGLKPSISISYSSQGSNGILGYGWSIDGLSSITRGTKNIFNDGKVEASDNVPSDAFFIDGVKLIKISGTYGMSGSKYKTESENYSDIEIIADCANGPFIFQVTTKEGLTLIYGCQDANNGSSVNNNGNSVYWRLYRVIDRNSNYYELTYENGANDSRIKEINYTGNLVTGMLPYSKIIFEYLTRTDRNTVFEAGLFYNQKYLLAKVIVSGEGNQLFRTYDFNYSNDDLCSFLKEVTESDESGLQLNSTIFKFGEKPADVTQTSGSVTGATAVFGQSAGDVYFGDFNGDGLSDIMSCEFTT